MELDDVVDDSTSPGDEVREMVRVLDSDRVTVVESPSVNVTRDDVLKIQDGDEEPEVDSTALD